MLDIGEWSGELHQASKRGAPVIVASRWSLQPNEKGVPSGTLESNTDVTERRQAENMLRRTQETYLAEAQQLSHTGSFGWKSITTSNGLPLISPRTSTIARSMISVRFASDTSS